MKLRARNLKERFRGHVKSSLTHEMWLSSTPHREMLRSRSASHVGIFWRKAPRNLGIWNFSNLRSTRHRSCGHILAMPAHQVPRFVPPKKAVKPQSSPKAQEVSISDCLDKRDTVDRKSRLQAHREPRPPSNQETIRPRSPRNENETPRLFQMHKMKRLRRSTSRYCQSSRKLL